MAERSTARRLAWLLLAAVFGVQAAEKSSVEDVVTEAASDDDYIEAKKCLRADTIDRIRPLSDRHIVLETGRNERWLLQLPMRCPGLRPDAKLAFEQHGFNVCEWDFVRVVYDDGLAGATLGARCRLPKFESVTRDQVDALRVELKNRRRGARPAAQ